MEEAFFNRDFWRQLVAVLIGAFLGGFLGFGAALLTGVIFWLWRRRTFARITRQIIVMEAIDNLRGLRQMDNLIQTMRKEEFAVIRTSKFRPRAEILRQFMTAETLDALSEEERKFLMNVTPQLGSLNERYDGYVRALQDARRALSLTVEREDVVAYRETATDGFLEEVAIVGNNLLSLLIQACCQAKGQLADDQSKDVASKLEVVTPGATANYGRAFKSSLVQAAGDLDPKKWLVVWEHDWPGCPMPVIELGVQLH